MKVSKLITAAFLILSACAKREKINEIIIEGKVKGLPNGKVYLAEAHNWQIPLDSTVSKDGYFVFKLKPDSSFVPFQVSMEYPDSTAAHKIGMLIFRNHTFGPDSLRYFNTSFFVEKGRIKLMGEINGKNKVRVFASKETNLLYKYQIKEFGWLGNKEGTQRLAAVKLYKKEIRKHPYSYFLLTEIYNAKEQYSEKELKKILALFNEEVQESGLGIKIKTYLTNRVNSDQPYPNLNLAGADNQKGWIMNNSSKVNMLVFWASWCGPCRAEIPQLKETYKTFKAQGLNLVSISIDEKPNNWQKALSQEKMNWQQFIVPKDQIDLVKQKFNFSAIPLVILTDHQGKEILKVTGSSDKNSHLINAAISKQLAKSKI